jgi:hypothetical protein
VRLEMQKAVTAQAQAGKPKAVETSGKKRGRKRS